MTAALAPDETFRFDRLQDLARLPWFDVEGDRLVVSDPEVGPVIDMHAHYALPTLWPRRIDLENTDRLRGFEATSVVEGMAGLEEALRARLRAIGRDLAD